MKILLVVLCIAAVVGLAVLFSPTGSKKSSGSGGSGNPKPPSQQR